MLTVSDVSRALADCGDGVEVRADGHPLLTVQVEGVGEGRFLNLVSQPEGVRVPADPTLPAAQVDADKSLDTAGAGDPVLQVEPVDDAPIVERTDAPADAGDETDSTTLI